MKHDTPEFIAEVLPVLKRAVEHRQAAEAADDELMDLMGCWLTDFPKFVDTIAATVESANDITEDNVTVLSDQVHSLLVEDEDDEDEDDDEDEEQEDAENTCIVCEEPVDPGGDSWDDLCPGCADAVSDYMDEHNVDRDVAIDALP